MEHHRRVFFDTLIILGTVLGAYVLYSVRAILITLLVALIFAAAVRPLVVRLQRRLIPKPLAILIVYLAIFFFAGILLLIVVPPVVAQVVGLAQRVPDYAVLVQDWLQWLSTVSLGGPSLPFDLAGALNQVLQQVPSLAVGAAQFSLGLLEFLFGATLVLVMAFYWLMERDHFLAALLRFLPRERRRRVRAAWEEIEGKLGAYVRGQLILAVAVGVMAYVGLRALGIEYALVLAIFAAVTELIPFVGPVLGAIPAVLLAFLKSPLHSLAVLILFVVIQQLENHILVPKILQYAVGMSPLIVILALLVGGSLLGIVGALVAIPVAAALYVAVQRLVLGEPEA